MRTAMVVAPEEVRSKVTIEIPKRLKDELEREALDRKQRDGGRFGVGPIIVTAIESYFASRRAEESASEPPKTRKREPEK